MLVCWDIVPLDGKGRRYVTPVEDVKLDVKVTVVGKYVGMAVAGNVAECGGEVVVEVVVQRPRAQGRLQRASMAIV